MTGPLVSYHNRVGAEERTNAKKDRRPIGKDFFGCVLFEFCWLKVQFFQLYFSDRIYYH